MKGVTAGGPASHDSEPPSYCFHIILLWSFLLFARLAHVQSTLLNLPILPSLVSPVALLMPVVSFIWTMPWHSTKMSHGWFKKDNNNTKTTTRFWFGLHTPQISVEPGSWGTSPHDTQYYAGGYNFMFFYFLYLYYFFYYFCIRFGVLDKSTHQDLPEECCQGLFFFVLKMTHVDDENN